MPLSDEKNVWVVLKRAPFVPGMPYRIASVGLCRSSGNADHDAEALRMVSQPRPPIYTPATSTVETFINRFYFPTLPSPESCPLRNAPIGVTNLAVSSSEQVGSAKVDVDVDEAGGTVFTIATATSPSYGSMAVSVAKHADYWPAMKDCKPVSARYRLTIETTSK